MAKRRKKVRRAKSVCPARFRGRKVKAKRMKGGTRCYIVLRNGRWRFVSKRKGGRRKKR